MRAVLDACVLYPTVMREMLIGAASEGFFEARWSPRILEEWRRAGARDGPEIDEAARVDIALLRHRFPDAEVQCGHVRLDEGLPDPDDDHVLAAAIEAGAGFIITLNHKDFPARILSRYGLSRSDPDALLLSFFNEDAAALCGVVEKVAADAAMRGETGSKRSALIKTAGLPRLARAIAKRCQH